MIVVRQPEEIHQIAGEIENGSFSCRCHFSFDEYHDPEQERFGTLLAFNDNTFTPGSSRPLHPHRDIEVVTYCVEGEFRHADEYGPGSPLKPGWVQHITVGRGMWHAEINGQPDRPVRFVQMWFAPVARDLIPSVEQMRVERDDRSNRLLPVVSTKLEDALPIFSDAEVRVCFLETRRFLQYQVGAKRGVYLYVVDGGPVLVNGLALSALAAAKITDEHSLSMSATAEAEILLADVRLT